MTPAAEIRIILMVLLAGAAFVGLCVRKGERIRALALLAGWAVPGAGHAILGRWKKGFFFLGLLAATCLFGLWITGFQPVSFDENPFYFIGRYGSGSTFLLTKLLGPEKSFPRLDLPVSWYDPGLLYVCVAGLLNLVIVFSLIDHPLSAVSPAPPASTQALKKGAP